MEDSIHHKQLREKLAERLRMKGIHDQRVLSAIRKVPRHLFLGSEVSAQEAYEDKPIEIGKGQTISQPYTVAYQTSLLDPQVGEKVLEIGTGSGYQSALLFELGVELYSIERQRLLHDKAKERLTELGYGQIHLLFGDGTTGWPEFAPFHKILVTAAAPGIPTTLSDQLAVKGVMVVPVNGKVQRMLRITRLSATETNIQEFDDFRFVPLLSGTQD